MPLRLSTEDPGFEAGFAGLLASREAAAQEVDGAVAQLLAEVARRGDAAVIEATARFDKLDLTPETLRISDRELEAAVAASAPETLKALELAAERIRAYHARQLPADLDYEDEAGVRLGHRWRPLDAVGLYVPGGTAAYPSSVLMNALPARVAGVPRIAMVVPSPGGRLAPLVLAAARLCGIEEVYRIGGAQAVGALAHGTQSIAPVDKIVGPGNAYVAAAKRQVFGRVGIDAIAGPSEILVVADADNDPEWLALDLLSQAEHDSLAQAILISPVPALLDAVEAAVARCLETLPRREIAGAAWRDHGALLRVRDLAEAAELANRIAPEHLELAVADPDPLAARVRHAGAVFLGRLTPEAVGDYVGGPNHVLPTDRSARFSSGLSVLDFMKRSSFLACSSAGLKRIGPAAVTLARAEGLDAHGLSIAKRLEVLNRGPGDPAS